MTEQELREMVRDSISRLRGTGFDAVQADPRALPRPPIGHASHLRLPLAAGGDGDGACIIEPSVRCTHCGYCQSYGH